MVLGSVIWPFQIVPVLMDCRPGMAHLRFTPTAFRQGTIRLGKKEYTAILSQSESLGQFDQPMVSLRLDSMVGLGEIPPSSVSEYLCGYLARLTVSFTTSRRRPRAIN